MTELIDAVDRDLAGSRFTRTNLSGAAFDNVNLSGATFHNINLRGARFSAVDFGGAHLACVNTGEGHPRAPVTFRDVELDDCRFEGGSFSGVQITNAAIDRMTIGGVLVSDMMAAYTAARRAP